MEQKSKVRKNKLQQRETLSKSFVQKNSRMICERILSLPIYHRTDTFLVYASIRNEVDLNCFVKQAWRDGKNIYFPKVTGNDMEFFPVQSIAELKEGSFHVPEPFVNLDSPFSIMEFDKKEAVVLVPGVAFCENGYRIGYGKGFYDRYLRKSSQLLPIGICFECQMEEPWECDFFDIAMHQIVTEKREVIIDD